MKTIARREFVRSFALGTATVAGNLSAAEKPRIKIGQIGTGHGHANKISVYRQSADYDVVGIVETDLKLRAAAEKQAAFAGLKWLTREELFAIPGLQAALIETKVPNLLDHAESAIDHGFHIHLDKPAGASLPHLRRIMEKAKQKERLIQVGYMFRYNPAIMMLREFLKKGWLGEVCEINTVMGKIVDPVSRQELAQYTGGIMFELGCHVLDSVVSMLGKPTRVTPYHRHSSILADKLNDNMLAVLEYPKTLVTIKASAVEVDGGDRRHMVVCGTEGTFHIQPLDNPSAKITLSTARGEFKKGTQEIKFEKYQRYVGDAGDMAKIIRGEKKADFSPEHDLLVQETLLKASGMSTN